MNLRHDLIKAALTGWCSQSSTQLANPEHVAASVIEIADATLAKLQASEPAPVAGSAEVDWSLAPDWAQWHAWDNDSRSCGYWYHGEPSWDGAIWQNPTNGTYTESWIPKPSHISARDSLTRRPGGEG